MAHCDSRACWFGTGLLLGAAAAAVCAMLVRAERHGAMSVGGAAGRLDEPSADFDPQPEVATDVVEYRGFVIHVFCHALGAGRYKAKCDIWESGAVALEGGSPPAIYATPSEARVAAVAWARHWVQNNG